MKHIAYHDELTGLPNRHYLSEYIDKAISLAQRIEKMLAVLYFNLDDFKMIYDSLGHSAGDQLLVDVSNRLKMQLREYDVLGKIGGDTFTILVQNLNDQESIDIISSKILACFDDPYFIQNQVCFITVSIGIAVFPVDGHDSETLLKNAEIAFCEAKSLGKNQYAIFSQDIKDSVMNTMKLSNSLYRVLERNEFELYYQPQLSCHSNKIVGLEAVVRWNHPEFGIVSPSTFIPITEQTDLINSIGEWVLRTACQQNMAWQIIGYPKIPIAVNVSVLQLHNDDIVRQIDNILFETKMEPQYLELEITEFQAIKENEEIIKILETLRKIGVKIAIVGVGIQFTSLSYLKEFPVDTVKIDMSFVNGIDKNFQAETIIKSIIRSAKDLGLNVIAEGVEEKDQLEFLAREKCDEVQGYYCYKPMPKEQLEKVFI